MTADDIIRALRQNPEALEQARRMILTDELLELPATVAEMRVTLDEVRVTQNEMHGRQNRMEGQIGNLMGADLERRAARIVPPRLAQNNRLRRPRVLYNQHYETAGTAEFLEALEDALDSSAINGEQYIRLLDTDLIMMATRRDTRETAYFAVETSGSIARSDITRSIASAEALGGVYKTEARPAVAGHSIRDEEMQLADDSGVEVVIIRRGRY